MARKNDIPDGVGLLISDVVDLLQRKGYGITAQQIRQYEERDKLLKSVRTKGNYREYLPNTIDTILFIRRLEISGYSKKRIKDFFTLQDSIRNHPKISTVQKMDDEVGGIFLQRLSVEVQEGSVDYLKIEALIDRYTSFCDEIKQRFESIKDIMDTGLRDIEIKKMSVKKLIGR